MTKYFLGYTKDDPDRADVCVAESGDQLTGPEGGYDSWDGPFTKHEAYAESRTSGEHVTIGVADCPECEDIAADGYEQRRDRQADR